MESNVRTGNLVIEIESTSITSRLRAPSHDLSISTFREGDDDGKKVKMGLAGVLLYYLLRSQHLPWV